MPDPQAAPLHVSPQQQDILEHIVRRTTSAQRLVKRSRIILLAITGMPNTQIAQQVRSIMKRSGVGAIGGEPPKRVCRSSKPRASQNC